jgi:CCR4-NOT transcriptional complex subunit CAF120
MSSLSNRDSQRSESPTSPPVRHAPPQQIRKEPPKQSEAFRQQSATPPTSQQQWAADGRDSPQARQVRERQPGDRMSSRPMSMVQTYQPPLMELTQDTLPELQPIFTYLNSHGNKLYQEGYFLKLDDQNSRRHMLPWTCICKLIYDRWQTKRRQNLDRMLCSACWHYSLIVGCSGT